MSARPNSTKGPNAAGYGILAVISIYCVVPFFWLAVAAFDPKAGLFLKWPDTFSLDNFYRVFFVEDGIRWLFNSLVVCGLSTLLVTVLSGIGGYALSRIRAWWKRPFLYGIVLIRIIPSTALIVPLYTIALTLNLSIGGAVRAVFGGEYFREVMRYVGFIDGYLGLIVLLATMQLPLGLWIMKTYFDTVSAEYEEAAIMDGASFGQRLRRILIPMAMPGLAATGLFAFISAWGDFLFPLTFISSPELKMLPLGIYSAYLRANLVDYGLLAAIGVIYAVPAILAFALARRVLVQTFSGGLKG
jgi:multiple sugar transport system permease protein